VKRLGNPDQVESEAHSHERPEEDDRSGAALFRDALLPAAGRTRGGIGLQCPKM
jgi:hypothetical protein